MLLQQSAACGCRIGTHIAAPERGTSVNQIPRDPARLPTLWIVTRDPGLVSRVWMLRDFDLPGQVAGLATVLPGGMQAGGQRP